MQDFAASSNQPLAANVRAPIRQMLFAVWPYRLVRLAIAVIFLWSGVTKIFDPGSFAVIIDAYGLLPETWIMPVAIALPVLELIAGVGLLFDASGSLTLTTGLLLLFIAILGYGVFLGLDVDCGCFGPEDPEATAFHSLRIALYRDLLIMAGIAYLYGWRLFRAVTPIRWTRLV